MDRYQYCSNVKLTETFQLVSNRIYDKYKRNAYRLIAGDGIGGEGYTVKDEIATHVQI